MPFLYKVKYLKHSFFDGPQEIETELTQAELIELLKLGSVSLIEAKQAFENGQLKMQPDQGREV